MIPVEEIPNYYRKGILIDTNLLLLLLIGVIDADYIKKFGRTKSSQYSIEDFTALHSLVFNFTRVLITPNILTETSYFIEKELPHNLKEAYYRIIDNALNTNFHEEYAAGKDIVKEKMYIKLGLTDASILVASKKEKCLVITDDFPLSLYLDSLKIAVINFTTLRMLYL